MLTKHSLMLFLLFVVLLISPSALGQGPFSMSGNSSTNITEGSWRNFTKPTSDTTSDYSENTTDTTAATAEGTYQNSTLPTANATTRLSENSLEVSKESSQVGS